MRLGVGVGDRHHDPEGRPLGARREPLVAVDDPLAAVPHRSRLQSRRIGPRHVRLGHGEERADLARYQWLQPALLLLLGTELPEDLPVARIRRLAAEEQLAPERAADLLVQERVREEASVGAPRLGGQVRSPQALVLRDLSQSHDQLVRPVVLAVERLLVRVEVLLHEGAHVRPELEHVVRGTQIGDRHGVSIAGVSSAWRKNGIRERGFHSRKSRKPSASRPGR